MDFGKNIYTPKPKPTSDELAVLYLIYLDYEESEIGQKLLGYSSMYSDHDEKKDMLKTINNYKEEQMNSYEKLQKKAKELAEKYNVSVNRIINAVSVKLSPDDLDYDHQVIKRRRDYDSLKPEQKKTSSR